MLAFQTSRLAGTAKARAQQPRLRSEAEALERRAGARPRGEGQGTRSPPRTSSAAAGSGPLLLHPLSAGRRLEEFPARREGTKRQSAPRPRQSPPEIAAPLGRQENRSNLSSPLPTTSATRWS